MALMGIFRTARLGRARAGWLRLRPPFRGKIFATFVAVAPRTRQLPPSLAARLRHNPVNQKCKQPALGSDR